MKRIRAAGIGFFFSWSLGLGKVRRAPVSVKGQRRPVVDYFVDADNAPGGAS